MIQHNSNNNNNNFSDTLKIKSKKLYETILEFSKVNENVKFLRLVWVDLGNRIRTKALSIEWILKREPTLIHVTVTDIAQAMLSIQDTFSQKSLLSDQFGEVYLIPDETTIKVLPYNSGHAQIFASFYTVEDATNTSSQLVPWPLCVRNNLKVAINKLRTQHNLSLKGSFEVEFYLIKLDNGMTREKFYNTFDGSINSGCDKGTFGNFNSLDSHSDIINKITDALGKQDIPIEQVLKESGPGQFEITIDYTDIMEACDRHIQVRQTINNVSSLNGYLATFIPKLYDESTGNGCHAHLSLWDATTNENTTPDVTTLKDGGCGIGKETQLFIGGILKHAKSLTALFNATSNSYSRLGPYTWSGSNITWGLDNKEAFVRIPSGPFYNVDGCSNFEVKTIDHSANPYFAMSAIIHSGIDGIVNSIEPPTPTSKFDQSKSIKDTIPTSLQDALKSLQQNHHLCNAISPQLTNAFINLKLAEDEILEKLSPINRKLKILELY